MNVYITEKLNHQTVPGCILPEHTPPTCGAKFLKRGVQIKNIMENRNATVEVGLLTGVTRRFVIEFHATSSSAAPW